MAGSAGIPMNGGDVPFVGAVVTSLVSDGQHATAFGWDVTTEASLTWTSDGGPWARHRTARPHSAALPWLAAGGGRPGWSWSAIDGTRGGRTRVFWHRNADGSWEPERSPVLGVAPDPSVDECGAPPTDAVEFVNLDLAFAAACYGDTPLTVRLWSATATAAGGRTGSLPGGVAGESSGNVLYVSPVKWPDRSWATAVLAPGARAAPDPSWLGTWLELTGHFDDPAAARCHWTPPPDQLQYYPGARSLIEACRQQFVVTKVRVVDGP